MEQKVIKKVIEVPDGYVVNERTGRLNKSFTRVCDNNQREYIKKWNKKNQKIINLILNTTKDQDILNFMFSKSNKNGYLKDLIRKDMNS